MQLQEYHMLACFMWFLMLTHDSELGNSEFAFFYFFIFSLTFSCLSLEPKIEGHQQKLLGPICN